MAYRSSWELEYMQILDSNTEVLNYWYEFLSIPYYDSKGKKKTYYPDFIVAYKNARIDIIEVKADNMANDPDVLLKKKWAIKYLDFFFKGNETNYVMITSKDLPSKGYSSRIEGPHNKKRSKSVKRKSPKAKRKSSIS